MVTKKSTMLARSTHHSPDLEATIQKKDWIKIVDCSIPGYNSEGIHDATNYGHITVKCK